MAFNKNNYADFFEKVKEANDIVSVTSKYLNLQKKGRTYWANCPFHHENTPSLAVNEDRQIFKCFGCGVGGDCIKFVKEMERVSYFEAAKILAEKANIPLPTHMDNESSKELLERKKRLYLANRDLGRFYYKNLKASFEPLSYLKKRGLTDDCIFSFGLGFSRNGFEAIDYLKSLGYTEKEIIDAGIGERRNDKIFDVMYGRIVFPIMNYNGDIIGFSGRALKDGAFAKYRNTSQTIIFDKSNVVFGINHIKEALRKENLNSIILVEGQMDVISLHNAGFNNVVASLGTAFTSYHAKTIKRYVDNLIVCLDGDSAGIKATMRTIDIAKQAGLIVRVISLPNKMDPDEFVKKYGTDEFNKLILKALPMNDYKLEMLERDCDLSTNDGKNEYVQRALALISKFDFDTERDIYLKVIRDKVNVTLESLRRELSKITLESQMEEKDISEEAQKVIEQKNQIKSAETFILSSIIFEKDYANIEDIKSFNTPVYNIILDKFKEEKRHIQDKIVLSIFKETLLGLDNIEPVFDYDFTKITNPKEYYSDCIKTLKLKKLSDDKAFLDELFEKTSDIAQRQEVLKKIQKISQEMAKIK